MANHSAGAALICDPQHFAHRVAEKKQSHQTMTDVHVKLVEIVCREAGQESEGSLCKLVAVLAGLSRKKPKSQSPFSKEVRQLVGDVVTQNVQVWGARGVKMLDIKLDEFAHSYPQSSHIFLRRILQADNADNFKV